MGIHCLHQCFGDLFRRRCALWNGHVRCHSDLRQNHLARTTQPFGRILRNFPALHRGSALWVMIQTQFPPLSQFLTVPTVFTVSHSSHSSHSFHSFSKFSHFLTVFTVSLTSHSSHSFPQFSKFSLFLTVATVSTVSRSFHSSSQLSQFLILHCPEN